MTEQNLDSLINSVSYKMVYKIKGPNKTVDSKKLNNLEKVLGVLVNDGVYAYYVYCKSQKDNTVEQIYVKDVVDNFEDIIGLEIGSSNEDKYDNFFLNISKDLHKLLFFRDILERILIYAKYHCKAFVGRGD